MLNITDIKAEIAALSPETREWLGVDEQGNRRTNAILHPSPLDRTVWAKVLELGAVIPNLKASIVADVTELDRTLVSKSLKYLVESGLMTTAGVRSATTYSVVEGGTAESDLPTVLAKTRGRKAAAQEPEQVEAVEAVEVVEETAKQKAPKRRTKPANSSPKAKSKSRAA